jgi:hypothetical protein
MVKLEDIIKITEDYCKDENGSLRSRQVVGLAKAITVKINEELEKINIRISKLETKI